MSEQIREQVSAFLDGELPSTETELLLKRLTRDGDLRESFGRFALIGEALRGGGHALLARGFASRVNLAIDGEPVPAVAAVVRNRGERWWRPAAGAAVVAGVAAVAIVAMQQRSLVPGLTARGTNVAASQTSDTPRTADSSAVAPAAALAARNREAISYTVPVASDDTASVRAASAGAPTARLTNYMFAHSKYSYGLAQRSVLADLLINADEPAREPAKQDSARVVP